jgi:branched-chain amino acid transport system substrate-binding protein
MKPFTSRFFVSLISFICFVSSWAAAEPKDLPIGVMFHLTGDFAAWGKAYLEGVELAQEEINASGGVNGRKLKLVVEDIRFDPRATASASKKLLDIDRVPISLISTFTEVQVAGPMFERAKVPLVVVGDSDEELDRMGDYIFSTGSWVKGYAVSASRFMREGLQLKRVATLTTNNPWSKTTSSIFSSDFKALGGEVVDGGDVNPQETDFRSILLKIRGQKVDGLYAPITANSVPFFKAAREIGLTIPIVTAGGALDNDVVASEPRLVEGRYVANAYLNPNRAEAARLLTNYRTKFGQDPLYPSVMSRGYDGFMTVADALKKSSDFSSEQIKNALYRVDFQGIAILFSKIGPKMRGTYCI